MKAATHLAAGVSAGILLSSYLNYSDIPSALPIIAAAGLGSLLPDIDICTSKLGSKAKPVSFMIQLFIGHRTLFHGALLYMVAGIFLFCGFPDYSNLWLGGLLGVATHLVLDMLNPAGVPLLWPLPVRFSLKLGKSGGLLDWILSIVFTATAIILAWNYLRITIPT